MHTSASCASDSFMKRTTEVVRGKGRGGGGLEIHSTIYIVLSVHTVSPDCDYKRYKLDRSVDSVWRG